MEAFLFLPIWRDQLDMANAESLSNLKKRYNARIAIPTFKATNILLAYTREFGHLFLREAPLPTQADKIAAD